MVGTPADYMELQILDNDGVVIGTLVGDDRSLASFALPDIINIHVSSVDWVRDLGLAHPAVLRWWTMIRSKLPPR